MRTHLRTYAIALVALACPFALAAPAGFVFSVSGEVSLTSTKPPSRMAKALDELQVGDKITVPAKAKATITLYGTPSCRMYELGSAMTVVVAAGGRLLSDKKVPLTPTKTIPQRLAPDLPANSPLRGTTVRSGPGATFNLSGALRTAPESLEPYVREGWLSEKTRARVWVHGAGNKELFDSGDVALEGGRTKISPQLFPRGVEHTVTVLLTFAWMADGARTYRVVVLTDSELKKVEAFDSSIDQENSLSAGERLVLRIRFYLANGLVGDARVALANGLKSISASDAEQLRQLIDLKNQTFRVLP